MSNITIEQAMDRLRKAMKDEPDYAYSWHANIAMACYDSVKIADQEAINHVDDTLDHMEAMRIGNEGASRFMKICFDAETSQDMMIKQPRNKG